MDTHTNHQIRDVATGAVVVGFDGSPQSEEALAWGVARASLGGLPLLALYAVDSAAAYTRVWSEGDGVDHVQVLRNLETDARRLVEQAAERARGLGPGLEVRSLFTLSDARHALLEAAEHAQLVAVGSRGRGPVSSLLLGSVSVAVSRHAACPVVVVRPGAGGHGGGILVGVDARPSSEAVLDFAFREASLRGLPLTVLHTHVDALALAVGLHTLGDSREVDEAFRVLAEAVAGYAEKFPDVEVTRTVRPEQAERALLTVDPEASLVVVGRRLRAGPIAAAHAGLATMVLERAGTTVAVVPTP